MGERNAPDRLTLDWIISAIYDRMFSKFTAMILEYPEDFSEFLQIFSLILSWVSGGLKMGASDAPRLASVKSLHFKLNYLRHFPTDLSETRSRYGPISREFA